MSMKKNDSKTENRKMFKKRLCRLSAGDVRQTAFASEQSEKIQLFQKLLQREEQKENEVGRSGVHGQKAVGESGDIGEGLNDISVSEFSKRLNSVDKSSSSPFERSRVKLKKLHSRFGLSEVDRQGLKIFNRKGKKNRSVKLKEAKKRRSRAKKLDMLNEEISWIYSESSWTEGSDEEEISSAQVGSDMNLPRPKLNESFRDHVIRELLKQGKDLDWYIKGTKQALDKIDKQPPGESTKLNCVSSLSREVSDFLIKSTRPYYRMRKTKLTSHRRKESASRGSKSDVRLKRERKPTKASRSRRGSPRSRQTSCAKTDVQ